MKVVIYCRVGSPAQFALEGLDNQEEYLKEYCEKHSYEVAKVFSEQISGNKQPRPEPQKVMKMISGKEAEGIVVKDLSRISRDMYKFFNFESFLKENGAKLIDSKLGVLDYSRGVNPVYERR